MEENTAFSVEEKKEEPEPEPEEVAASLKDYRKVKRQGGFEQRWGSR